MVVAEAAHEVGRDGALRAKRLLQELLGSAIELPFNAYDHPHRLEFIDGSDVGGTGERFRFDLGGVLKKKDLSRFDQQQIVEVFVEVKARTVATNLLDQYRTFLRHAAIASVSPQHEGTWFIFYATVPFGSSKAGELIDGTFLRDCSVAWAERLKNSAASLSDRVVLAIATDSFVRLVTSWKAHAV